MRISEICIRRPVFATVHEPGPGAAVGIVSYDRLTVREYPNIDEPVVTVATTYPGASRRDHRDARSPSCWKDSHRRHRGHRRHRPRSAGRRRSQITVRFRSTRDPDVRRQPTCATASAACAAACRTRSTSRSSPRSRPTPSRSSIWPSPATGMSPLEITDYADRFVKDRLQEPARRRRRAHLRRAALCHAHLARSGRGWPPTA